MSRNENARIILLKEKIFYVFLFSKPCCGSPFQPQWKALHMSRVLHNSHTIPPSQLITSLPVTAHSSYISLSVIPQTFQAKSNGPFAQMPFLPLIILHRYLFGWFFLLLQICTYISSSQWGLPWSSYLILESGLSSAWIYQSLLPYATSFLFVSNICHLLM